MNSLVKRELVRGLPQKEFCQEGLCDACEKGKSKKASHRSKGMTDIGSPLQLIHMDLFGPVNIPSISRKRYALVIVDDYSKYTWVLFLHSKDEAALVIIDHIKKIEKEANLPVRAIRSDNGTEF
uniref:Integrase catalytic domain-containing protein n=1 Tax=Daucus carota subsp. sativus TaxID=79200 RepID=A0A161ZMT4_DAUCS